MIATLAACQGKPPSSDSITGGDPRRGLDAIQRYGCGACHRIDGVPGAYGKVGPTLQNIGERAYVAGKLPDLGVGEIDARDIAAFLYHQ
ncbi:cytochrome C [Caballeronia sp. S22]|uniref:cytochrome C n=1 Tax=Caballeronia sp. S22 TaxID=3137182 RepID=UPI0035315540